MWRSPADGIGGPVDPDDARQRADDILSRAEYQEQVDSIFDRALDWIGEQLGRLFFGGGGGIAEVIPYVLVTAAAIGIVWTLLQVVRSPGPTSADGDDERVRYGTESIRTPAVWLDEAERLASAGEFRGALRCRHQALIATWITDQVIDHVVGRTAAECHDAAAPAVDSELSRHVVATFDAVWYGDAPVDADVYRSFGSDCEQLARTSAPSPSRVEVR